MRFVRNLLGKQLEGEAKAKLVGMGEAGQQAVVVSLATTEAVSLVVEGHAGDDSEGDATKVREQFARRFKDTIASKSQTIGTGIAMQDKVVTHNGRQDDFLLSTPTIDEGMGSDLIGQRVVEQYGTGLHKHRMLLQSLEHRYRKGFQLLTGVGSLYGSDGLAEDTLRP
jgi:hypothetical protein